MTGQDHRVPNVHLPLRRACICAAGPYAHGNPEYPIDKGVICAKGRVIVKASGYSADK